MKLKKLTIHNIASIEDAVIDFASEPLSSSDVFLITGKTGAGKSTILDAICLALYADTPRLKHTKMQGDLTDTEGVTVTLGNPIQMMRRGAGEAFVQLTFTGSNGVEYKAEWSVSRSRNKPSGKLQKKAWCLTNLNTGHSLTGDREVKPAIQKAIGLDFDQFCRTTMLAQGDFASFLNSKDDEKVSILEKITGTDVYRKIGIEVFKTYKEKEAAYTESKNRMEGVTILRDEEIAEMNSNLQTLSAKQAAKDEECKVLDGKIQWLTTDEELTKKVAMAETEKAEAGRKTESEEFQKDDLLVKQWKATADARGWVKDISKAEKEASDQKQRLTTLRGTYLDMKKGQLWEVNDMAEKKEELGMTEDFIESQAQRKGSFENAQTILGHLKAIIDGRKGVKEEEERKAEAESLVRALEEKKTEATTALEKAESEFTDQDNVVKVLEKQLDKADLPGLRSRKDSLENISNALGCLDRLEEAMENRQKTSAGLKKQDEDIRALKAEAETLEGQLQIAKKEKDTLEAAYKRQQESVHDWAQGIRAKLRSGELCQCPVCQQKVVSLPIEEDLSQLNTEAENAFNRAQAEYDKIREERDAKQADIKSQENHYLRSKSDFERDTSVDRATEAARQSLAKLATGTEEGNSSPVSLYAELTAVEGANLATLRENLAKAKNEAEADLNDISLKISAAQELENGWKAGLKTLDEHRKAKEEASNAVLKIDKDTTAERGKVDTSIKLIASKEADVSQAETEVSALIDPSNWENNWRTATSDFAEELKSKEKEYSDKLTDQQRLKTAVDNSTVRLGQVENLMAAITGLLPEWQALSTDGATQQRDIVTNLTRLQAAVQSAKDQLSAAEGRKREAEDSLNEYLLSDEAVSRERIYELYMKGTEEITTIDKRLTALLNDLRDKKAALEQLQRQREENQAKKPQLSEGDTVQSLQIAKDAINEDIRKIGEERGAVSEKLRQNEANRQRLEELSKEMESRKVERDKWESLNKLIGDSTGKNFQAIAQSYVLGSLINSANSYMRTLSDRYRLIANPGTFVISVEDSYNGYSRRSASTISGGESFLVSLALALALSDIGQRLSVNTLFIDEGFGTLDGEYLQTAVDTLRALHSTVRRNVGIISHIESLQERIPVQISVEQSGNNSSSSIVRIVAR